MVKKVWRTDGRMDGRTDRRTDGLNQSYSCLVAAKNYDEVRSQFCTCHDCSATVTSAKFWPEQIIRLKIRWKRMTANLNFSLQQYSCNSQPKQYHTMFSRTHVTDKKKIISVMCHINVIIRQQWSGYVNKYYAIFTIWCMIHCIKRVVSGAMLWVVWHHAIWHHARKHMPLAGLSMSHKISNISSTKSQTLHVSCLILQLSLSNPWKPGIKLRMKM